MGQKGVHISVAVVVVSAILVLASFCTDWQHLSAGFFFSVDISLTSITASCGTYSVINGLRGARDMACTTDKYKIAFLGDVCSTLTRDYVCAVLYMVCAFIAIILDAVAIGYLGFYIKESAHTSYRKIAFHCMVAAPVLLGLGVLIYVVAMATGTRGWHAEVSIVLSPGLGLFCSLGATMVLIVVPFLSKTWVASTAEALVEDRRILKKEAIEQALFRPGDHQSVQQQQPKQQQQHVMQMMNPIYAQQDPIYLPPSVPAGQGGHPVSYAQQTHQIHLQPATHATIHHQPTSVGTYPQSNVYQQSSEMYPPPYPSSNNVGAL